MVTNDIGKMALLALVAIIAGAGLATGKLTETAAVGVLGTIVGYLTGNGVNAVRRNAPSPVIVARETEIALPADVAEANMPEGSHVRVIDNGELDELDHPHGLHGLGGPPWKGPHR